MPGSPATTPILAIPRLASTDPDNVPGDLNAVADRIDAAVGSRLHDPGDLKWSARPAAPAGWLLCDGAAISRTTYATLFAAIGTAFGAGDGSTTFNVPDLRGRAPIGAGAGTGLTNRTRGATLGEEAHRLTPTEMNAGTNAYFTDIGAGGANATGVGIGLPTVSHNTMQPSTVTNVFIKT